MKKSLWARWKTLARHAARIQSNIILTVLYFLVFQPLALIRRPFSPAFGSGSDRWREREPAPHDVSAARRQF